MIILFFVIVVDMHEYVIVNFVCSEGTVCIDTCFENIRRSIVDTRLIYDRVLLLCPLREC